MVGAAPAPAATAHGRRARLLLQRYLVVFGPVHSLAHAGADDGAARFEALVLEYFAGRVPTADSVAAVHRLTDELAVDAAAVATGPGSDDPWRRFDALCDRLGLDRADRDVLLLLVAPVLDAGTRWLAAAVIGDQAWPRELLRRVLAPLTSITAATWSATSSRSTLLDAGLVVVDDERWRPAPALLDHLATDGDPAIGHRHDGDGCARTAALAPTLTESLTRVATALETAGAVVVRAGAGDGAAATAAWVCHRRRLGLVELTVDELAAAPSGALIVATAGRGRGALVHGLPDARGRQALVAVVSHAVPIVVAVARDTPPLPIAALCQALCAAVVDLPPVAPAIRHRWWRDALGASAARPALLAELAVEPVEPHHIARALDIARLTQPDPLAAGLLRVCRDLTAGAIDDLVDRVVDRAFDGGHLDQPSAATAVAAMSEQLGASRPGVVFVDTGPLSLAPIAHAIARELGLRAYQVTAARALAQSDDVARWLARVLAAAPAVALVLPDVAALVAGLGGDRGLLGSLLRSHPGLVFVSADERAYFTGATDATGTPGGTS